jgi:hypothetical protein
MWSPLVGSLHVPVATDPSVGKWASVPTHVHTHMCTHGHAHPHPHPHTPTRTHLSSPTRPLALLLPHPPPLSHAHTPVTPAHRHRPTGSTASGALGAVPRRTLRTHARSSAVPSWLLTHLERFDRTAVVEVFGQPLRAAALVVDERVLVRSPPFRRATRSAGPGQADGEVERGVCQQCRVTRCNALQPSARPFVPPPHRHRVCSGWPGRAAAQCGTSGACQDDACHAPFTAAWRHGGPRTNASGARWLRRHANGR